MPVLGSQNAGRRQDADVNRAARRCELWQAGGATPRGLRAVWRDVRPCRAYCRWLILKVILRRCDMVSSHDTMVESRPRELWADNLRVLVVAGVIVVHAATGYLTGIVDWYYAERTTSAVWSTLLSFPAVAGGMFGLGPLFLLAGWFSPQSLARALLRTARGRLGRPAGVMCPVAAGSGRARRRAWPAPRPPVLACVCHPC
jgi:hypothetical protein